MQPSNPSPEEHEARKRLDRFAYPAELDAYARAVYERGVRDGLTQLAAESEDGTYVFGAEEIIRFRDSLRTLTPTESPNE